MIDESRRLLDAIVDFIAADDPFAPADIRAALRREVDADGPEGLRALETQLSADDGWTCYPPAPLAGRIHHLLADRRTAPAGVPRRVWPR